CRRFIYTENLLPASRVLDRDTASAAKPLEPPNAALPVLQRAISQLDSEDGWVDLGTVGRRLSNLVSDFDPRTYGFEKLSDLVRKTGAFEVDQPKGRGIRIRIKAMQRSGRSKA